MGIKKKKYVLLENEVSDWLQIWTAASSLDVKGNKAIKKKFVFLSNHSHIIPRNIPMYIVSKVEPVIFHFYRKLVNKAEFGLKQLSN